MKTQLDVCAALLYLQQLSVVVPGLHGLILEPGDELLLALLLAAGELGVPRVLPDGLLQVLHSTQKLGWWTGCAARLGIRIRIHFPSWIQIHNGKM